MIEITPSGAISFIAYLYEGNMNWWEACYGIRIFEATRGGDTIMADWGLNFDDILPPGVLLNVASMLNELCSWQ